MTAYRPGGEDVRLLAEIGYMAAIRLPGFDGSPIFAALDVLRPNHSAAAIGRALQALARRDPQRAVEILERQGITRRDGHEDARGLLVLALSMAGEHERARRVADELAAFPGAAQRLARTIVDGAVPPEPVDRDGRHTSPQPPENQP